MQSFIHHDESIDGYVLLLCTSCSTCSEIETGTHSMHKSRMAHVISVSVHANVFPLLNQHRTPHISNTTTRFSASLQARKRNTSPLLCWSGKWNVWSHTVCTFSPVPCCHLRHIRWKHIDAKHNLVSFNQCLSFLRCSNVPKKNGTPSLIAGVQDARPTVAYRYVDWSQLQTLGAL